MSSPRSKGFLRWPFRIDPESGKPETCDRKTYVRQQIEQVLFTLPGERAFRSTFGAGVEALVFEPNGTPLWEIGRHRIHSAVAEALRGEAAPDSVQVEMTGRDEELTIVVRYTLAALQATEEVGFTVPTGGPNG